MAAVLGAAITVARSITFTPCSSRPLNLEPPCVHGGGCHSAVGTLSTSTAGSRCPRTALPELPPTATRARLPAAGGCRRLPPPACPLLDRGGARTQPGDGATACNSWCCSACGLSDMPCTGRVQCCCYRHASAAPAGHPVMGARRARPIPLLPPRPLRIPPPLLNLDVLLLLPLSLPAARLLSRAPCLPSPLALLLLPLLLPRPVCPP